MVEEATEFAEQDKKERERVDARNTLEGYVFQAKSTLNGAENGRVNDNLTDDEVESANKALEDVNEWLDDHQSAEKEDLDDKLAELKDQLQPLFTKVYERSGVREPGGVDDDLDNADDL